MIYCVNFHFHYLLPSFYACTGKPTTSIQSVTLGSIFTLLWEGATVNFVSRWYSLLHYALRQKYRGEKG